MGGSASAQSGVLGSLKATSSLSRRASWSMSMPMCLLAMGITMCGGARCENWGSPSRDVTRSGAGLRRVKGQLRTILRYALERGLTSLLLTPEDLPLAFPSSSPSGGGVNWCSVGKGAQWGVTSFQVSVTARKDTPTVFGGKGYTASQFAGLTTTWYVTTLVLAEMLPCRTSRIQATGSSVALARRLVDG